MEEVVPPLLHQPGQLGGVGLIHQLPLGGAVEGDNAVPVGDRGDVPGGRADGLAHLGGKFLQISHRGVFPENHAPVLLCVNLQRVTFPDTQGSADFLRDDDPTQVV